MFALSDNYCNRPNGKQGCLLGAGTRVSNGCPFDICVLRVLYSPKLADKVDQIFKCLDSNSQITTYSRF